MGCGTETEGKLNFVPTLLPIKASLFTVLVLHARESGLKGSCGNLLRHLLGSKGRAIRMGEGRRDGVIKSDASQRGSRGRESLFQFAFLAYAL
jgi:hypothetical protein